MSLIFEAVVFEGDASLVRAAFDRLPVQLSLRLFQFEERRFVLFCWTPGAPRKHAIAAVSQLAENLSAKFEKSLAVHYDDRCDVRAAELFQAGSVVREFGEADEVWTPVDDDFQPLPSGARYSANSIPDDVECDCIRQAIDVGLEAAGFDGWLTLDELQVWACSEDLWLAQRLSPAEQ